MAYYSMASTEIASSSLKLPSEHDTYRLGPWSQGNSWFVLCIQSNFFLVPSVHFWYGVSSSRASVNKSAHSSMSFPPNRDVCDLYTAISNCKDCNSSRYIQLCSDREVMMKSVKHGPYLYSLLPFPIVKMVCLSPLNAKTDFF